MRKTILSFLISFCSYTILFSQCVLPGGTYEWGFTDLNNFIILNCGGSPTGEIVIPSNATISIKDSDQWDLTGLGAITLTIEGSGSLVFSDSDDLTLASGSFLIIDDVTNADALDVSGLGTDVEIVIGATTFPSSEFPAIIAAGGASEDGLLPVEMADFTSHVFEENKILISWTTISETDNSHFEVEHSKDGIQFRGLGRVEGAGTTDEIQHYKFVHSDVTDGFNYYRIKIVSFDEVVEYSKTITQRINLSTFFELKYNTIERLGFELKEDATVDIYNLSGQLLEQKTMSEGIHEITLSDWQSGMYLVRISTFDNDVVIRVSR